MSSKKIIFCATGIDSTTGGIASVNRNIKDVLGKLAVENKMELDCLVLNEPSAQTRPGYSTFSGNRIAYALALFSRLRQANLVFFDHVQPALPILLCPKFVRPKFAVFAHGSEAWLRLRRRSKLVYRTADLVLTNSKYTLDNMRRSFAGFNGVACPLGLPLQFVAGNNSTGSSVHEPLSFRAVDGEKVTLGSRVLILVSRLDLREQRKGHAEILQVLPSLVEKHPTTQVVFVGSGDYTQRLRDLAKDLKVDNRVVITGHLEQSVLETLYQRAYAFVMPSRQEGFGLVYLEAMKYGLPCIACLDDGGADVVEHGKTGFLVNNPIELDDLGNAIDSLLSDEQLASRLGQAGKERLEAEFLAPHFANRLSVEVSKLVS